LGEIGSGSSFIPINKIAYYNANENTFSELSNPYNFRITDIIYCMLFDSYNKLIIGGDFIQGLYNIATYNK